MDVRKNLPTPLPVFTIDITGITEDEAVWLRDLLGKFPAGLGRDFHSRLYSALLALTLDREGQHEFETFADGYGIKEREN